jgi:hypothetical protein
MASAYSPGPRQPGLAEILETLSQAARSATGAPADKIDLDSYHPGSDFKVRITPTDEGGTEFFFPPMRGAARATTQTAVFLVSLVLFMLAGMQGQPSLPLLTAWGIIESLFFLWILRLCSRPSEW